MKKTNIKKITTAAIIAALYVVLTFVANSLGLASGAVQVRISEALTVLPYFTSAAIPGLAVGCFAANLLTGCAVWDIVFGTLATLIGAIGTYLLRKHKYLAPLPPIVSNAIIVPFVLIYTYGVEQAFPFLMLTVGAGEVISAGILGIILLKSLEKSKISFFN